MSLFQNYYQQVKKGEHMDSEKQGSFAPWEAFFDAAPPRSNPASRVFRYPHSFSWGKNP
jgi:hypothetical protein